MTDPQAFLLVGVGTMIVSNTSTGLGRPLWLFLAFVAFLFAVATAAIKRARRRSARPAGPAEQGRAASPIGSDKRGLPRWR